MNPDLALLERILWSEVARAAGEPASAFDAHSSAARAIREVLGGERLHAEELALLERWDARRETSQVLLDRLLQARVNRAVRAGHAAELELRGAHGSATVPRVVIVRADGPRRGVRPSATVVEFLEATGSLDLAELAPGARIEELVDMLVLANEDAAEQLAASLRAAGVPHANGAAVDLADLGSQSIRVLDVERALAALEELVRGCIPPERRPAPAGAARFERELVGELLGGKYRVKALKGKGAFKTVYEGEDEMLGARVAIAVLNPKGARSERSLARFHDEARLLTTLDHENIVRWITFDRAPNGLHYFVMEYLDGEELERVLRREGRLAPARVGAILLQVLAALKRAHAPGTRGALLHLDLKPENVFLLPPRLAGEPVRVKVIDFGIGQHVGADVRDAEQGSGSTDVAGESEGGEPESAEGTRGTPRARRVKRARGGTLLYTSPEQCRHLAGEREIEPLDGRSDLYSLGVMAFRMLTGEFPFADCASAQRTIRNHLEVEPRKVGALGIAIPRALAAFVDRCLLKDPARRFRDAAEAHAVLERIVHPRRSPLVVALPVLALAALAVGWVWATRATPVSALTLLDPAVTDVAARAVSVLDFGPRAALRALEVESDFAWDAAAPPEPRLVDAGGAGAAEGWNVRWSDTAAHRLEIEAGPGARSRAVMLELAGRRRVWRTARLTLAYLGAWRIESALVEGHDGVRALDPRGRRLVVRLAGDPEACTALDSLALFDADGRLVGESATQESGERAVYAGPPLDALFTGAARTLELRVLGRDRAGQEEELRTTLALAGASVGFAEGTGFVASAEPHSLLLPGDGETQVLLRGNALRILASAPARARVFLEPEESPRVVSDIDGDIDADGAGLLVTLTELGLGREDERRGTLRLELTDDPWVEREPPAVAIRRLAFLYTPRPPRLEVVLQSDAGPRELAEASTGAVACVNVGTEARLLVRPPPGTDLWLEGAAWPEDGSPVEPARLVRESGPFELPLALASEGRQRIVLRSHVLLAGAEKGPWIPPEHVYLLEVDRTSPRVELELQDDEGASLGAEPLFTAELPRAVRARVVERGASVQRWTLERPGAAPVSGTLDGAGEHDLWPLVRDAIGDAIGPEPADGQHALALEAVDEAGNRGVATLSWQIARAGPRLALVEPQASGEEQRWILGSRRSLDVRVRASDANGVAAVTVDVVYEGRVTAAIPLVASAGDLWEIPASARPSVHSWWSGRELALAVRAEDRAGQVARASWSGVVPEIPRAARLLIAPRDDSGAALVEVPAGVDYAFGGRNGENRAGRAWSVLVPGASFPTYFLDAREVNRAEFRAFVEAEDGFASARYWPAADPGAASNVEARRAAWRLALAGDPELSVTGVTWDEAAAYALWRGKRLPTLVEWEFAVRGTEYRELPADEPPLARGAPDWPGNLCWGAREWTGTPARLGPGDFATQARRNLAQLLRADGAERSWSATAPSASAGDGSHWVVGSAPGEPASWSARAIQPDRSAALAAGFRCALDREAAFALLESGVYEER